MSVRKNYYAINKSYKNYLSGLNLQRTDKDAVLSVSQADEVQNIDIKNCENDIVNIGTDERNEEDDQIISATLVDRNDDNKLNTEPEILCIKQDIETNISEQIDLNSSSESSMMSPVHNPIITSPTFGVPIVSNDNTLDDELIQWYNEHNIPLNAFKHLLNILKKYHTSLPADPRTLLHTSTGNIEKNANGDFIYYGIQENLHKYINFDLNSIDTIKLDLNIDGVPVFKSKNSSFWPILCSFDNSQTYAYNSINPFIVAIFYGTKKPEISQYLSKLIDELNHLMEHGVNIKNKFFKVELRSIIADAPAKSFLKQSKTHGGYSACDRCITRGTYKNKSMSYENLRAELRTDTSFRERLHPEHHVGKSPLENLNIDMINTFPIDYMHLILLGIVKKLLSLCINKVPYKMSATQKRIVNDRINIIKKYFPCEFNRKPRVLEEMERYKATEFRHILLYTGIVIFKDQMQVNMYNNFLVLMFIVRILCDESFTHDNDMLEYAKKLCLCFVKQFKTNFPTVNVSYNVHCLIHIVDDVKRLGVLDSFSSFPYENCLGNLKRKIRSSNSPLAQVSRRISEGYVFCSRKKKTNERSIIIKGHAIIPGQIKDACVLLTNKNVAVVETVSDGRIIIRRYKKIKVATKFPCESSALDIYVVRKTNKIETTTSDCILKKCVIFPYNKYFIVLPLL